MASCSTFLTRCLQSSFSLVSPWSADSLSTIDCFFSLSTACRGASAHMLRLASFRTTTDLCLCVLSDCAPDPVVPPTPSLSGTHWLTACHNTTNRLACCFYLQNSKSRELSSITIFFLENKIPPPRKTHVPAAGFVVVPFCRCALPCRGPPFAPRVVGTGSRGHFGGGWVVVGRMRIPCYPRQVPNILAPFLCPRSRR